MRWIALASGSCGTRVVRNFGRSDRWCVARALFLRPLDMDLAVDRAAAERATSSQRGRLREGAARAAEVNEAELPDFQTTGSYMGGDEENGGTEGPVPYTKFSSDVALALL